MPSLQQAKTLGGVGSILGVLAIVPTAGPVLAIAGIVMVLIAVKHISDMVGNKSIFHNMIISVVLAIAGIIVGFAIVISAISSFVGRGFFGSGAYPSSLNATSVPPSQLIGLGLSFLGGLAAVWILFLIGSIFLRRSFNTIAERLGVGQFRTAGLLYLIGSGLIIAIGVGFIILFVAAILEIVAFFSIPEQLPQPMQGSEPPPPMPPATPSIGSSR